MEFDASGHGLGMVLKDYQEEAMRFIWAKPEGEGASSRDVWVAVNKVTKRREGISRASIINFLNAMVDEGALSYTEITGKGGHRRIYRPAMTEAKFKIYIAETVLGNLKRDFPDEVLKAIGKIQP